MNKLMVLNITPIDSNPKSFTVSTDFIKAVTEIPVLFQQSAYKFKSSPEYFTRVNEVTFIPISKTAFRNYKLEDKCKNLCNQTFSYNKRYIIVVTADIEQILIQFDSLQYLDGVLSTLYWLERIHSIDCILDAKTFRRGRIRIKDSNNDINRDQRIKTIKSYLSGTNLIDDLIDIVIDYIKGLCERNPNYPNNVIECRNYHEDTDDINDNGIVTCGARCDMCYNHDRTKFSVINAELIF